ncbi:hypothetical protein Cs7R123_62500 [Catellatospora sp. TT07R-123]|uniref:AAA family ATPase n=1 Tax=Catellatospora sp. TT07R-123 TaxID=2733863 RepID=UPI001B24E79D|nr:ATP-binding protein [Catellatospora sp. TT07R-123]GHJ48908.1 hypothetical protein Cs7R123_62500 [Catellatospora sp. TT07R-123]
MAAYEHPAPYPIEIDGVPGSVPAGAAAAFRGRLHRHARELFDETGLTELRLRVRRSDIPPAPEPAADEPDQRQRMSCFVPTTPRHRLDQAVLPPETLADLMLAVDTIRLRGTVFDDWGLREIEPHPRAAVNLHGAPGTGKTLVAHGIAAHLGAPILLARTSQLESKFHGEGGKNLAALFGAAARAGAVLFVDEAESLLSRRFDSVGQASEHAVNTLRAELVQHLDTYEGVVVFATNLVESYDPAIGSRLSHVHLPEPDRAARAAIWRRHLPAPLRLDPGVDVELLAETSAVGRDIKRAVIAAALAVARRGGDTVTQHDLASALDRLLAQRPRTGREAGLTDRERQHLSSRLRRRTAVRTA